MSPDPDGHRQAVILDLDGVVTETAALHARAWKRMFDEFLKRSDGPDGPAEPFDIDRDYREYVDGKPRYDGVRSFLESRGIRLPEGRPEDEPGAETVSGLGKRKNDLFHELLRTEGVTVFPDAVEQIRRWRQRGIKLAVVSSSRNCAAILESAGLTDLFDVRVDGTDLERLNLSGKPAPDLFLEAARRLGVDPGRATVVEDALAGVQAGRAGGFGTIVGVVRDGNEEPLRRHGAGQVVRVLTELGEPSGAGSGGRRTPTALLDHRDRLAERIGTDRVALFLDYDGTLTPIVERPERAQLAEEMRSALREITRRIPVAIISGRDLPDVRKRVGLDDIVYAGSHGFDIAGPDGLRMQHEETQRLLPDLNAAEEALRDRLATVENCQVERKRFAIAVHYRRAAPEDVPHVERVVDEVRRAYPSLRKRGGKKIFELLPDVDWDKGRAVLWLLEVLDLRGALPVYVGDDETDEDAFLALGERGLGIRVSEPDQPTHAQYFLRDTQEVERFLHLLIELLDQREAEHETE